MLDLRAINDNDWLVGHLRRPPGAPFHAFVCAPGSEIKDLGTFGGPFSHGFSVNGKNQVVGSAQVDHQITHAFLWNESEGMRDLGTLGGTHSVARDINNWGHVVGESYVNAGQPSPGGERAFLWSARDGMVNLGESFDGWSRAVAINDHGVVIGSRQRGALVCGFVWSRERGATDIVGIDGRSFYPTAVNDDGLVVGEGDDSSAKRRAFTWTLGTGLKQLDVLDDFHPSDLDARGNILGNVHSRPWQQPGIYDTRTGRYFELPAAYNHQTSVVAMNRAGTIVGLAHTGPSRHWHAVIWRLSK